MKQQNGHPGISSLAGVIDGRIGSGLEQPLLIDFAIINTDWSLKTNTYEPTIPAGEWLVLEQLTFNPTLPMTQTYEDQGEHSQPDAGMGGAHVHDVKLPKKLYQVRPGDRVVVAWIGGDCVVLGRFISSLKLFQ